MDQKPTNDADEGRLPNGNKISKVIRLATTAGLYVGCFLLFEGLYNGDGVGAYLGLLLLGITVIVSAGLYYHRR